MDDAVPQSGHGIVREDALVCVHRKVDCPVADGVRADVYSRVVKQPDLIEQHIRFEISQAGIAFIDIGKVLVPVLVHPGRAYRAAAVDINFHAGRHDQLAAVPCLRIGKRLDVLQEFSCFGHGVRYSPQREHAHGQITVSFDSFVSLPVIRVDLRILDRRDPFCAQLADERRNGHFEVTRRFRDDVVDQVHRLVRQDAGGHAVCIARNHTTVRVRGIHADTGDLERPGIRDTVMRGCVAQPDRIVG